MGMKAKLYFSVAATIFFASIIQNIVLLKRIKKRIKIFKLLTYLCRLSSFIENAFIQFYNKSMFFTDLQNNK